MRRTLLALALCGAFALTTTTIAQAPPGSLWYDGDFDGVNGFSNERNTLITQCATYMDFNVPAPLGWNLTAVFSHNLLNTVVTGADWEIRSGVSEHNGGTLIANGTHELPRSHSYRSEWVRLYRIHGRGHGIDHYLGAGPLLAQCHAGWQRHGSLV
jgi:hypothetical protein